jgi:hypothetical protein
MEAGQPAVRATAERISRLVAGLPGNPIRKTWGLCSVLDPSDDPDGVLVHEALAVAGGCSVHLHPSHINEFEILEGSLLLAVWDLDVCPPEVYELGKGDLASVGARTRHQFFVPPGQVARFRERYLLAGPGGSPPITRIAEPAHHWSRSLTGECLYCKTTPVVIATKPTPVNAAVSPGGMGLATFAGLCRVW